MEDKQDDFCEIKQRKAQATGDSVSSLVSDMEKIEIEEDDWVILPPDASINIYMEKTQTAWKVLLKSALDQSLKLKSPNLKSLKMEMITCCKCGCTSKPGLSVACRRVLQDQFLRLLDFRHIFDTSGSAENTVDLDLQGINSRITSIEAVYQGNSIYKDTNTSERVIPASRFILRTLPEFEAALTFFLGWLKGSFSTNSPHVVLDKLCKLVHTLPEVVKVSPDIKFRNEITIQTWASFFRQRSGGEAELNYEAEDRLHHTQEMYDGIVVTTPCGATHQVDPYSVDPNTSSTENQVLVFEEFWLLAMAKASKHRDATELEEMFFTMKHLALAIFDYGNRSEALSLYIQIFTTEYIFLRSWDVMEMTLKELATVAFCCHEPLLVELFLQNYNLVRRKELPSNIHPPWSTLPPRFSTMFEFFDDSGDLLSPCVPEVLFKSLNVLEEYFSSSKTAVLPHCRLRRALSRMLYESDAEKAALYLRQALNDLNDPNVATSLSSDENELDLDCIRSMVELDLAVILSKSPDQVQIDEAQAFGQAAFRGFIQRAQNDESLWVDAFSCRDALVSCGIVHWAFDKTAKAPFTIKGTLGSGAYSIVNSVTWMGGDSTEFAQKIYRIPARSTTKAFHMAAINNELDAIRKLKPDPHLVRIEYTYTERQTFVVVLSPRADEDLQSYLERQRPPVELSLSAVRESYELETCIRRWFYCLASSLAKIHDQGVRHKDIKSRNILLKDSQVLYADFGSSKTFESELTSSTTGTVNSGNTPMYSAPEVMANQRRSRSADIFSLGCVFTEMLTVKGGKTLADFHEFRTTTFKDQWGNGYQTCAYHKTLDKVDQWFHADPDRFPEYRAFIRPMLAVDRLQRPSAQVTATAILEFYIGMVGIICEACAGLENL